MRFSQILVKIAQALADGEPGPLPPVARAVELPIAPLAAPAASPAERALAAINEVSAAIGDLNRRLILVERVLQDQRGAFELVAQSLPRLTPTGEQVLVGYDPVLSERIGTVNERLDRLEQVIREALEVGAPEKAVSP